MFYMTKILFSNCLYKSNVQVGAVQVIGIRNERTRTQFCYFARRYFLGWKGKFNLHIFSFDTYAGMNLQNPGC